MATDKERIAVLEKALRLSVMQLLEADDYCAWCPLLDECNFDIDDFEYCMNKVAEYWKRRAEQGDDVV